MPIPYPGAGALGQCPVRNEVLGDEVGAQPYQVLDRHLKPAAGIGLDEHVPGEVAGGLQLPVCGVKGPEFVDIYAGRVTTRLVRQPGGEDCLSRAGLRSEHDSDRRGPCRLSVPQQGEDYLPAEDALGKLW